MLSKRKPLLIVVSAPSGAGKTTLCDRILLEHDNIDYSISCTTRAPRGKEEHGKDYYFLSEKDFIQKVSNNSFIEHAVVHNYNYGTLKQTVEDSLLKGRSLLMDIDVKGADQIRAYMLALPKDNVLKNGFIDIFIKPPSLAVLRERLEKRGEDLPDVIDGRLKNAEMEINHLDLYKYVIINDDLERAYNQFKEILAKEMGAI